MSISSISSLSSVLFPSSKKAQNITTPTSNTSTNKISVADFTNMTPTQMLSTMNNLIKNGKMSVDQSTGIMGVMPTPLSKNYASQMNQPMNFISALQQQFSFNQSLNNNIGAEYDKKGIDILSKLQGNILSANITA